MKLDDEEEKGDERWPWKMPLNHRTSTIIILLEISFSSSHLSCLFSLSSAMNVFLGVVKEKRRSHRSTYSKLQDNNDDHAHNCYINVYDK